MPHAPWLNYLGVASAAIPPLATLALRRRPRGAAAWVLAWTVLLAVEGIVGIGLASRGINNHWLRYVAMPADGALILWAVSLWQMRAPPARALRVAIPVFLALWTVLVTAVETTRPFSTVAEPLVSLICLGAAAFTLVARSVEEREPLVRQDWFWTCGGLTLYFGSLTTLGPLAALLGGTLTLLARAYELKSVVDVVAFLAIARGITCRTQARPSGVSSSPASSPSALSSSPSALR